MQLSGPLDQVQVFPPGDEVTVYFEITAPPFETGADHDTVTAPFPALAMTAVGAPGSALGTTLELAAEMLPLPNELIATAVKT